MFTTTYNNETSNIADAAYTSDAVDYSAGVYSLADKEVVRIDRIRLITSPGFPMWDLSYMWGTLKDGRHVRVEFASGRTQFPRRGSLKGFMIEEAKLAGRYAKGLGMLDYEVISTLW